MTTQQVISAWTTPDNYCQSRNDYYFNLSTGRSEIETKSRKRDQAMLMSLGRKLPGTVNHAKYWIANNCQLDVIMPSNIRAFAEYADMIGFVPTYKFTKSGGFVRVVNLDELNRCIANYFKAK